jgi:MFS transporter, NNP family, nitrate/nitrite transporter
MTTDDGDAKRDVETTMSTGQPRSDQPGVAPATGKGRRRAVMLGLAALGFAVNFWAWALLSPLAPKFKDILNLSSFQQALLVAVPVVVGSVGRIPVGALTDRFGGRIMFPLVSLATIVPVLYLGLSGHTNLTGLLVGGFFLGIGGTAFAVGVPFVNAWFPPERRGLAIGVFGAGMGGTAISALTTVKLVTAQGVATPFIVTAIVLAAYALLAALLLRDAPGRAVPAEPLSRRLAATARLTITWQASALYAVLFGGYVAFSVYLPAYLKTAYGLTQADAANRMAGFVLLAVVMRPVGGWLSDRFRPTRVLAASLAVVVVGATVQAFTPTLAPLGTIAFLAMAAALGAGSGATFALVALLAPQNKVGSVTGIVGAAGGLGGFVPPLIMGALYGQYGSYALGLAALAVVALAALGLTLTAVAKSVGRPVIGPARATTDKGSAAHV